MIGRKYVLTSTVLLTLLATSLSSVSVHAGGRLPPAAGAWYLALDAQPYGLPPGVVLPGMVAIDGDGTVLIADGGDFGGFPFASRDSNQFGSWRYTRGGSIRIVTLFLQADAISGDVGRWQKVQLQLRFEGRNVLVGTVNVLTLDCTGPAPAGVFNCPNPVASADRFAPAPGEPLDVPVRLERITPRFTALN